MEIRKIKNKDFDQVIELIAKFRVVLAELKNKNRDIDLESAKDELEEYLERDYPIYIADSERKIVGYLVCRLDDTVVWAESLYVLPRYRRQGIASDLFKRAEELGKALGNETIYNWIHPNNDKIINFLKKHGYDVLNLIELRKKISNEKISTKINVNKNEFNY